MNELSRYIFDKQISFLPIYERLLSKYKNQQITIMEIGIKYGGSLHMWKSFLGSKAKIYGVDIVEHTLFKEPQIECFLGDQGDRNFLKTLPAIVGPIDVLIDDGSHVGRDQIATFEELFPYVVSGGFYFCEDLQVSYRDTHEGGYKKPGTMIEYCKDLIDSIYPKENTAIKDWGIDWIYFYNSLIVIKKKGGEDGIN